MPLNSADLSINPVISLDLVQEKFSSWWTNPLRSRRIPEDLWMDAVALCKIHSPGKVESKLRLSHQELKKRLTNKKSPINDGMIELKLADDGSLGVVTPAPLGEIVSPRGMILRLFSPETAKIIKAFVES